MSWVVLVALAVGLSALALLLYVWFFSDVPNFQSIRPMPAVKIHHFAFGPGA